MIYTFNNVGYVLYSVAKDCFELTDKQVYSMIQQEFEKMKSRLKQKGINYDDLKKALIPNTVESRHELCLFFDRTLIEDSYYGRVIFEKLLPILHKESEYSILVGDYIDVFDKQRDSQDVLYKAMSDVITICNESDFKHTCQYYLIYFSNIGNTEAAKIIDTFSSSREFYGYAYLDYNSAFKSYLSRILVSECVKYKKTIISSHPSDYLDSENIQMRPYPYIENGFTFVSINDESYEPFLHYKIESIVPDKDDIGFCFNALFPKFDSIEKLKVVVSDDKYYKYLITEKNGKGKILSMLGFDETNKSHFEKQICEKVSQNYIYNLEYLVEHDVYKFNICIEFPQKDGGVRKAIAGFKYFCESGELFLITFF